MKRNREGSLRVNEVSEMMGIHRNRVTNKCAELGVSVSGGTVIKVIKKGLQKRLNRVSQISKSVSCESVSLRLFFWRGQVLCSTFCYLRVGRRFEIELFFLTGSGALLYFLPTAE